MKISEWYVRVIWVSKAIETSKNSNQNVGTKLISKKPENKFWAKYNDEHGDKTKKNKKWKYFW